MIKRRMMKLGG